MFNLFHAVVSVCQENLLTFSRSEPRYRVGMIDTEQVGHQVGTMSYVGATR